MQYFILSHLIILKSRKEPYLKAISSKRTYIKLTKAQILRSFFSFQSKKRLQLRWRWAYLNTSKQNHYLNGLSQRWNKRDKILSWWITPLLLTNGFWFTSRNLLSPCFVCPLSTNPLQIQEKRALNFSLYEFCLREKKGRFQSLPSVEGRHRSGMELGTAMVSHTLIVYRTVNSIT